MAESGFDEYAWLRDFADHARSLHLLCEQWLYQCQPTHGDNGGCDVCEDIEGILRELRGCHFIEWEGTLDGDCPAKPPSVPQDTPGRPG